MQESDTQELILTHYLDYVCFHHAFLLQAKLLSGTIVEPGIK